MNKLDLTELNKDTIPIPVLVRGTHINEVLDESIIKPNLFQKIILKYKKKAIQIEEILQRQEKESQEEKEKILKLKEFICFEKLINYFDEKKLNKTTCKNLQEHLDILPQIEKPEIINIENPETINIKLIEDWIKLECLLEEHNRITLEHTKICEYCQTILKKCDDI